MLDAIVAVYRDWGIGADGTQPVVISADRKHFRDMTGGCTVIVGRKTLADFPGGKPLKGRRNIVLSRQDIAVEGAEVAHSAEEAVLLAAQDRCFVIGGESVYQALIPHINRVFVTKIDSAPHSDAFFPDLDNDPEWIVTDAGAEQTDENGVRFRFVTYVRRLPPALQAARDWLEQNTEPPLRAAPVNAITRRSLRIHYLGADGLVAYDEIGRVWYGFGSVQSHLPELTELRLFVADSAELAAAIEKKYALSLTEEYRMFCLVGSLLPAPHPPRLTIGRPEESALEHFAQSCSEADKAELHATWRDGRYFVGEDADGNAVGAVCVHPDTSIGQLEVLPAYRGKGYADELNRFLIQRQVECGFTPCGQVAPDNVASLNLQHKMGLTEAEHSLWFIWP